MTNEEAKSCIDTIKMLRRSAYNIYGVIDVIDSDNCEKIIKVLSDIPKYKDAYGKGWDDGAKATYEHLKMCEEETETGHCKDCKWWKDSDGAYRRGIGAESQCPMNRIEVFEGNGYCYMFEPKESEVQQ